MKLLLYFLRIFDIVRRNLTVDYKVLFYSSHHHLYDVDAQSKNLYNGDDDDDDDNDDDLFNL